MKRLKMLIKKVESSKIIIQNENNIKIKIKHDKIIYNDE